MAEESAIGWTKSTFNPWIGCTEVGDGCLGCYARELDANRLSKTLGGATKDNPISHWGHGAPRYRTATSTWKQVHRWNRQAPGTTFAGRRGFWPVFCASLADVFDNEVPDQWRSDLWDLIEETPNLSWLLVTKRIGNAARMLRTHDWAAARRNVRILITVVNQQEADRDIPKLLALNCRNGISYEPALGPVDWGRWLELGRWDGIGRALPLRGIQWIICGGGSRQGAWEPPPFEYAWARSTLAQCRAAGVPFHMKQVGDVALVPRNDGAIQIAMHGSWKALSAGADMGIGRPFKAGGKDPMEWPADLRVQEFPL